MKYLIVLVSIFMVALGFPSHPYPIHPGVGAIYKGPNSETIIRGPDGSEITAEFDGGAVDIKGDAPLIGPIHSGPVHSVHPGPAVIHTGPSSPALIHTGLSSPALIHTGPALGSTLIHSDVSLGPALVGTGPALFHSDSALIHNRPAIVHTDTVVHTGPTVLHTAPIVLKNNPIIVEDTIDPKIVEEHIVVGNKVISVPKKLEENTDLVGPSGTISTRGGDAVILGPSSTTIKGNGVVSSIDKQPDLHLKAIEVKPVVAPAIVTEVAVAPVVETVVQPLVSHARPVLPLSRPIYAESAPVLGLGAHGLHPIIKTGPILGGPNPYAHSGLNVYPSGPLVHNYAPGIAPLGYPLKPIYRGHLH